MKARYEPAPLDVVLERLRHHGITYAGDPSHLNHWHAICPVCSAPIATLVVIEHLMRGPVSLRCRCGCSEADILATLTAEPHQLQVEDALHAAEAARGVLERALHLLRATITENAELREVLKLRVAA